MTEFKKRQSMKVCRTPRKNKMIKREKLDIYFHIEMNILLQSSFKKNTKVTKKNTK